MKNPNWICPGCHKIHTNPLIDHFNEYLRNVCKVPPPPAAEVELYRSYMAGMVDMLKLMSVISELPEKLAVPLVNQLAINARDACLLVIEDPALQAVVKLHLTQMFAIKETPCSPNN